MSRRLTPLWPVLAVALVICAASPAEAYVGPGAGFAVLSSFLVLFTTIVAAVLSLLAWPFRMLWRTLFGRKAPRTTTGRLIVIGFDGQDPVLTDRFLREGLLPNFSRLAKQGSYRRLTTTYPSVSPVAWSSFSTGTNPGRHNIFDFLDRDRRTYLPVLSSARVGAVKRFLKVGRFRIPREKPDLRLLRRSKPFWAILGEYRIWSTILRVPVTFPPDRFYGAELSAMSVPDLLGTQGTFLLFTTRAASHGRKEGGIQTQISLDHDRVRIVVEGPENTFVAGSPPLQVPLEITLDRPRSRARIQVGDTSLELEKGRLSDWVALSFRAAPGITVKGISRMLVTEMDEHFSLYLSPINIDPEKPAMPISHPSYYATYLAKRIGRFATLGLAEDTWALNEGVIDEAVFLQQTYDIDRERRAMCLAALDRQRRGALVCVFDATDRIQHMFWRYLDPAHPAPRTDGRHRHAIRDLYVANDAFIGQILDRVRKDDVLMVISDHGFSSFRHGVNLNSWLRREGYLVLKEGGDGSAEWLRDVNWNATRAYCLGLTGMFLNVKGREASGIVVAGSEAAALKAEIISKLNGLADDRTGAVAIREVFDTAKLYTGPYLENAPDLIIGYGAGYRTSWDSATGMVAGPVFDDNVKAWSGDHCVDPRLVPGVLFCNRRVATDTPALVDIAPTALRLFGIAPPAHMDGRPLPGLA
jgi:predicted AlkP superfamily phosphohydrolase/phosphomutase